MSVSKKSLENLKQPSKKKSEFAKAKTGMKYLTAETIREALSKNNNLLDSLEEATIRLKKLMQSKTELTARQTSELSALVNFVGKFSDKVISNKTELTTKESNKKIREELEIVRKKAAELKEIRESNQN